jgi:selenocysteine lyase/cysteine desulfurase
MSLNRREFIGSIGVGGGAALWLAPAQAQEFPTSSRELWPMLRVQPLIAGDLTWLDTASYGPTLRAVLIEEYRQREALSRDRDAYLRENCSGDALRALLGALGQLFAAGVDDLALTSGATEALNMVAAGLDFTPGDEILTTVHDHPAAVYPWLLQAKRRGLKVKQLALPTPLAAPAQAVEAFAAAITERTRLMCFSHVQYTDGTVLPVRELCALARERNVLTLVDGAQAVGMVPLDLRALGCDFYAASLHKWLNGPAGTGFIYFGDGARFRLWPACVAAPYEWDTVDRFGAPDAPLETDHRARWPAALRKFSYADPYATPLWQSLAPALTLQQEVTPARIAARIRELAWYLRMELQRIEGVRVLTSAHPELWAGIVSFEVPGIDHGELVAALVRDARINVRRVRHAGAGFDAVRASPHVYNDFAELERLATAVRRRLRR